MKRRPLPLSPLTTKQRGDAAEYLIAGTMLLARLTLTKLNGNLHKFKE